MKSSINPIFESPLIRGNNPEGPGDPPPAPFEPFADKRIKPSNKSAPAVSSGAYPSTSDAESYGFHPPPAIEPERQTYERGSKKRVSFSGQVVAASEVAKPPPRVKSKYGEIEEIYDEEEEEEDTAQDRRRWQSKIRL